MHFEILVKLSWGSSSLSLPQVSLSKFSPFSAKFHLCVPALCYLEELKWVDSKKKQIFGT